MADAAVLASRGVFLIPTHGVIDMAARKKKAKRAATPKKAKKAAARKSKSKKAVKKPAKKKVKAAAKEAPARKAAKKPSKKTIGEGDYAASRAFLKDQSGFVAKNKAKISGLGKEAEKALEGPEGAALREAEAAAAARSRDTF